MLTFVSKVDLTRIHSERVNPASTAVPLLDDVVDAEALEHGDAEVVADFDAEFVINAGEHDTGAVGLHFGDIVFEAG